MTADGELENRGEATRAGFKPGAGGKGRGVKISEDKMKKTKPRTMFTCKYCGVSLTDENAKTWRNGRFTKRTGWCIPCDTKGNRPPKKPKEETECNFPVVLTAPCCACAEELDSYAEKIADLMAELKDTEIELEQTKARLAEAQETIKSLRQFVPRRPRNGHVVYPAAGV